MCVHVNTLPDDCLLCIFDRIPLVDLLTLNRVCKRWKCLLPSACARRRTLVLIGGEDIELNRMEFHIPFNATYEVSFDGGQPYFGLPAVERENCLTLPYLMAFAFDDRTSDEDDLTELDRLHRAVRSGQLTTYLTALLPNIDKLVVIYPENDKEFDHIELHSVIQLVGSNWSLKILKLWLGDIYYIHGNFGTVTQYRSVLDAVRTLLQTIPQQSSSLQKLTLDIGGGIFDDDEEDDYGRVVDDEEANDAPNPYPLELYSFISQLKELKLYLGCSEAHYSICDIMHRFGSAQLMQNIGLGNDDDDFRSLATVLNPKFEFTTKVSQLYVELDFETVELFGQFCGRFPALTSLWMIWSSDIINFSQLVNSLASLVQLTHLYLDIDFEDQDFENVFALVDRVDGEERQISVLPHVKVLQLSIEQRSHDDFESLSPLVFSSVEVIILSFTIYYHSTQCIICRPYVDRYVDGDVDPTDRCHRLMILSLKSKFANNPRLYEQRGYGLDYKDWTDYVQTEEDALPVIGDDDGQVDEQPKVVEV